MWAKQFDNDDYEIIENEKMSFIFGDMESIGKKYQSIPQGTWFNENGDIENSIAVPIISPLLDNNFFTASINNLVYGTMSYTQDLSIIYDNIKQHNTEFVNCLTNNKDIEFVVFLCTVDDRDEIKFIGNDDKSGVYLMYIVLYDIDIDWSELRNDYLFPDKDEYKRLMDEKETL